MVRTPKAICGIFGLLIYIAVVRLTWAEKPADFFLGSDSAESDLITPLGQEGVGSFVRGHRPSPLDTYIIPHFVGFVKRFFQLF